MNTYQQLADKVKMLTVFCLEHRGRCFGDMTPAQAFRYVAFQLLNGNLFVEHNADGSVAMIVFLWPEQEADLKFRDELGQAQFVWKLPKCDADSFLIGQVIGKRQFMPQILKQVMAHRPDSPRKKLFTYRLKNGLPRLVELDWKTVTRFTYGHS